MSPVRAPIGRHLETLQKVIGDARAATVIPPSPDALNDFIGKATCGLPLFG